MLRRSVLELSNRRLSHIKRFPRQTTAQNPCFYASSSREFSTAPQQNAPGRSSPPPNKPSDSQGGGFSKVLAGSVAIGAAVAVAYSTGYLDQYIGKQPNKVDSDGKNLEELMKESEAPASSLDTAQGSVKSGLEYAEKSIDSLTEPVASEDTSKPEVESQTSSEVSPKDRNDSVHGEASPKSSDGTIDAENVKIETSAKENIEAETRQESAKEDQLKGSVNADISSQDNKTDSPSSEDINKDLQTLEEEPTSSLLDSYNLSDGAQEKAAVIPESGAQEKAAVIPESGVSSFKKAHNEASKDSDEIYVTKDGKLILDFLQAIHTAEQRQAELDARTYSEEKRILKEKYEKELKDARARELMYAEEAAMLDKEIKKETAKAAAALKSLQEKAEERLKMEVELKEKEAELKLKEAEDFAKAELAAAIAREKAAQIERMAEANLNINALCMAFYARSEEARQTHSIHKLALGALALEDALSKGRPIQPEVDAIRTHIGAVDKDSLLDLVLSSLPEEIQSRGTDTPLQLNQKFDELKGTLRHFSLIPPGGGGILAHSLAYVASFLKVKEADKSGSGIESIINRVDTLLAEGKIAEAADTLETGVQGSAAYGVAGDWVKQARNRAITEQALTLLHSYATSVSLT